MSAIACAFFFPVFVLAAVSFFSRVHVTVGHGWVWAIICMAVAPGVLVPGLWVWRKQRDTQNDGTNGYWRRQGRLIAGAFGIGTLVYGAVYDGLPIVAHYLTSQSGEMLVTVIAKSADYRRYSCRPRLEIKEFRYFSAPLCPGYQFYDLVEVGDTLRLEGATSPFGISVNCMYLERRPSR